MGAEETVVEVRRRLGAPPGRLFAAFADPRLVCRWLSPAPEITLTVLKLDFRVGGSYRFRYRVPGGQTMHVNGTFRSIEPPSRLVFSWNIEPPDEHAGLASEVTVSITPDGGGTELVYAALGAALSWSYTTLAVAAKNVMTPVPGYLLIETGFTVAQWLMVGPLTALAFRRPLRLAHSQA